MILYLSPENSYYELQTQTPGSPALGIADAEAAMWVFFSGFPDPAGTHSLYLKIMGVDYGRMKGKPKNPL